MSLPNPAPEGDQPAPAARRRARSHVLAERPTAWVTVTASTTLAHVLAQATPPEPGQTTRVYLVGDPARGGGLAALIAWADLVPEPWTAADHYLPSATTPTLRYRLPGGGTVAVMRAAAWYGDAGDLHGSATVSAAHALLHDALRAAWPRQSVTMLDSPAATGRDLWLRTIRHGVTYPTLPAELQTLIRSTSGQGRWQEPGDSDLPVQPGPTIDGMVVYDARFGYAGMASGLGVGPWTHTDEPGPVDPWQRGRYRIETVVPAGWTALGLVGEPEAAGGVWRWPREPGRRIETWVDGAELAMLDRHGWSYTVAERIVAAGEGKPLDTWRDRLLDVRDRLAGAYLDGHEQTVAALAAAAARMLVLTTVGSLHGTPHAVTRRGPVGAIPEGATELRQDAGGGWVWREQQPAAWPETSHPEWSSAIWARCRVRVLDHRSRGALHVDPADVLAIHQDAVYLTSDPGWDDDGKVGTLRRQTNRRGPWPVPHGRTELAALARGGCRRCGREPERFPVDGWAWCRACFPGWDAVPRARWSRAHEDARARNACARETETASYQQGVLT